MKRLFLTFVLGLVMSLPARAEVAIQQITTPGGINAWLVEEHSIPFTAIDIWFRGGTSLDEPGKRGATNLMMGLLEEGAGELDARGFAEAVEGLAARFGFDAFSDAVSVTAQFLTENRDEAVELLRLALQEPTFAEPDLERVRAQVQTNIRSNLTNPDRIASNAFYALAYGDHPYGSNGDGSLESVEGLTRDDIIAAHRGALARDRIYVGAVGDITADELSVLLDRLFVGLPETGAPMPQRVENALRGGVTVIDFETPQSVAIFGHDGLKRDDPDFFAAYVMNHILGGSNFGSRLTMEVREKRGLTYGVSSHLVPRDRSELMVGSVASANDRVAQAIDVVREVWAAMAEEGVTEEELQQAKTFLTGAYPLRFDGNARIAGILVGMQVIDLTPEYITTRNDRINAVTQHDIVRVARRLLDADGLHFVVVGQPQGLESTEN
jgi:zinc protease